jgi:hypothetical protein
MVCVFNPPRQQLTPSKDCIRLCTPTDNIRPLQKSDWGCAELNCLFEWADQVGGWQYCCHFGLWWSHVDSLLDQHKFQSSVPPSIPKEYNLSLLHRAQVNSPCISVTSPLSIPREYTHPAHCPGRLSYEWAKGMIMAPCWAFSNTFNF